MSMYKTENLVIKHVDVDFHEPRIISRKLREKAPEFIRQVRENLSELNQLIDVYNVSPSKENLQNIQDYIKLMEDKYPENLVALFPEYLHAIQHVLFDEIRLQSNLLSQSSPEATIPTQDSLISFIKELSPDSFARFLRIISKKYATDEQLGNDLDDLAWDDEKFDFLVDNYSMRYIGGANGKVFQLTNLEIGEELIVRYGERLDNPRDIESQLIDDFKDASPNPFPKLLTSRQGSYLDDNGSTKVCSVEVMSLFAHNLANQHIKPKDTYDRMRYACETNTQLGEILQDMQARGFMHADVKPSNILMKYDEHIKSYELKLMDRKSIFRIEDGFYDASLPANFWYTEPLTTKGISAPELDTQGKIDADKAHAYAIGINLFLTIISPETYQRIKSSFFVRGPDDMQYILEKCRADFPGEIGAEIMHLVENSTGAPENRPGVRDVLDCLRQIKQKMDSRLRESCQIGIEELKKMVPIYQDDALQEEFRSIIIELEKELANPKDFTLATLDKFIYDQMGIILGKAFEKHVSENFDDVLKANPIAFKVVDSIIKRAQPFRSVQSVIDTTRKIEYICQIMPEFNACKSLIQKQKGLDFETQDQLKLLDNKLEHIVWSVISMKPEENAEELLAEVVSEVLEIKLQQLLGRRLNLEKISQSKELQDELELKIAGAKPLRSEAQVETLVNDLLRLKTKVYQSMVKEEKSGHEEKAKNQPQIGLGSKF